MSDQWKGRVRSIAGVPVALVDVTITRTILLDPTNLDFAGALGECGLSGALAFNEAIKKLPESLWQYTIIPWTDADSNRINTEQFSRVISRLEQNSRITWRVEGTSDKGYFGILNFAGIDQRISLNSQQEIDNFNEKLQDTVDQLATDLNDGKISQNEHDLFCETSNAMKEAGQEVKNMRDICEAMKAAKDQAQKEQWRQDLMGRERQQNEKIHTGDFPRDYGDKFSTTA
jgi:hypothetical protein